MNLVNRSDRYCVIGAGSSGLAAAKNLRQHGIAVDVLERQDEIGGNWCYGKPHSSVCASTHTISSKRLTEYTDFPMPDDYPNFPHHSQVFAYLKAYAERFGLYEAIEFKTAIERVEPAGPLWQVTLSTGECRTYAGVVVANGHNWDPRWPDFPGQFDGQTLHSCQYKTPEMLRGKRVLVVGAGNSGCDIAVEAALHADRAFHSLRRGYYYIPKYLFGRPSDVMGERLLKLQLPLPLRRYIASTILHLTVGEPQRYGLPAPDHEMFESHPIINSQLPYFVGHGRITPKPNVAELCGQQVRFEDESVEAIDLIVYATGFKITFPFLDREYLNWRDGRPQLYLNAFHPHYDNLFVIGLIQPDSGQFGLVDYQSQLMTRFIANARSGSRAAEVFRQRKAQGPTSHDGGIRYLESPRNLLEVEHFGYRKQLQRELSRLSAA